MFHYIIDFLIDKIISVNITEDDLIEIEYELSYGRNNIYDSQKNILQRESL